MLALGFRLTMPEGGRCLYDLRGILTAAPSLTQNGDVAYRPEPESPTAETQSLDGTARPAKKPFFTDMWERRPLARPVRYLRLLVALGLCLL